jgi:ankyrin repeat protein
MSTEFFDSVRTGRVARLRKLLDAQPELLRAVDSNGETPVLEALYYGQPGALEVLLEHNRELDIFEAAALGRASRIGALLELDPGLLDMRSPDGYAPLHLAAFFGRTDAVRLLLERGADAQATAVNPRRTTPLHAAAGRGHVDTARLLLDRGANPNVADINGDTPLHLAARSHDGAMQRMLIAAGSDPALRNAAGETAEQVEHAKGYGESE